MKNILTSSILALATMTIPTRAAQATVAVSNNDLVLSFQTPNTPGNTINLEVDLGPADFYYNPTGAATLGTATPVTITNIGHLSVADLSSPTSFGSGWASRTDLTWGIAGSSANDGSNDAIYGINTDYLTRPETAAQVRTSPWNRVSNNNASTTAITSMYATLNGAASTANSTDSSLISKANANSYTSRQTQDLGLTFRLLNGNSVNDMPVASFVGPYISIEDLYALQPGASGTPGDYLGSFGLRSDGTIDYLQIPLAAVPEPATIGFGLAMLGACAMGRFRTRRQVVA